MHNCQNPTCNCGAAETATTNSSATDRSRCAEASSKIEELLRDELCAEESQPIREHLEHCQDCNAEKRVCEALTEAVQRGCREKAPTQLRDAILDALRFE